MIDLIEFLIKQDLYFIPLHSANNGKCSCMNENCSSPAKHPLLKYNWKIAATNDIEKINRWKRQNKYLNFAIATGRKSKATEKYLVVIDVDQKNHEIFSRLTPTFSYKTGGGGFHYWYWSRQELCNSVSQLAPRVDIRGKNGYAIIPPSKHISGEKYEFLPTSTYEIADLPEFIYDQLEEKEKKIGSEKNSIKTKKEKKPKAEPAFELRQWKSKTSVESLAALKDGKAIPVGVRNSTCFKLVASRRAKGTAEFSDLLQYALKLKERVEQPETFSEKEIFNIVKSVMKYPCYNTSHEKVNEHYIKWLNKNGFSVTEDFIKRLYELDNFFFTSILKNGENSSLVSIKDIMHAREQFFLKNNFPSYSVYKMQLMAKKLESLGFTKVRQSKSNRWMASIQL